MVIIELLSGLGNQLFQYAAGKTLSLEKKTPLKLDKTWFELDIEKTTPRNYGLDPYMLQPDFASRKEIDYFLKPDITSITGKIRTKLDSMKPNHKKLVYKEPYFHYDINFTKASSNIYLIGYWQSEKYFKSQEAQIRNDFRFRFPLTGKNEHWEQLINSTNAISLHVRRTDMINNPDIVKTHGSCGLDYYLEAANRISEGLEQPVFFIFSDDPEWCKANLHLSWPVHYIDNNQGDLAYIDMQLMSMCKHHVIANSSFSWWGAWLNTSNSKRVIAPKRWFADNTKDTSDLIPSDWMRI